MDRIEATSKAASIDDARIIVAGASAYSLRIDWERLRRIADDGTTVLSKAVIITAGIGKAP